MTHAVVRLAGVERVFPGPVPVHAVRGVDLEIATGEHAAIIGPSGSGKSTLLNLIGLLDQPSAGTYELDGVDTGSLSQRDRCRLRGERIGFVFQSFHLLDRRTIEDNVMMAEFYLGRGRAGRRTRACEALERVGLGHRIGFEAFKLSGGERQRVAIARAIMGAPALLLCDEPTGNLDSENAAIIIELLAELRDNGQTIVVVTHDPVVAATTQSIISLADGRVANDSRLTANSGVATA